MQLWNRLSVVLVFVLLLVAEAFSPKCCYEHRPPWTSSVTTIQAHPADVTSSDVVSIAAVQLEAVKDDDDTSASREWIRPYEQRAEGPRPARRLNHPFKHLYRHDIPETILHMDPLTYLQECAGYSYDQVLKMNQSFPPLLALSVPRQLYPKLRFLEETLQATIPRTGKNRNERNQTLSILPPQYLGARLERVLAPRHAFLVYANLTHGFRLVSNPSKWESFLRAVRKPKAFAALCQSWRREATISSSIKSTIHTNSITVKQIEAFDALFGRGLMAMARDDLVQPNNTWPLQYINITASQMLDLLIQHGANPWQVDHRGVSLLHWAAGTGHLDALPVLLRQNYCHLQDGATKRETTPMQERPAGSASALPCLDVFETRTLRDGATALHWAAAGAKARAFGCGGHVHVCRYLLEQVVAPRRKEYVNILTKDGNSALMWAAWSGTLETVKLLVRHRAETNHANRNGCTVAHWAASGGNLRVCQYLYEAVEVDFEVPNLGGNTPVRPSFEFAICRLPLLLISCLTFAVVYLLVLITLMFVSHSS